MSCRPYHRIASLGSCITLLVSVALIGPQSATMTMAAEITAEEFYRLPEQDRCRLLIEALRLRAQQLDNIITSAEVNVFTARYQNGEIREKEAIIERSTQEYRKIGDSYKYLHTSHPKGETSALFESWSAYDGKEGVSHMWSKHRDLKAPTARIDRAKDPITKENRFGFFLGGYVDDHRPSDIQYILEHEKDLSFEENRAGDRQIIAKVEFTQKDGAHEVRRIWIDPEKGFLITKYERRWERQEKNDALAFEYRDLMVKESRQIQDVWLPSSAVYVSWNQLVPKGVAGVYEIKLKSAEIGKLKPDDLRIIFPANTEVNDMIRRVTYVAGHESEAQPWESEVKGHSVGQPFFVIRYVLFGVALVVALICLGAMCLRVWGRSAGRA